MEGKRLLHSIRLQNLLSYGSEGVELELEPLNVLIGPNASGKSNLIEVIGLLAAAPWNLTIPFREGSPAEEWVWKGADQATEAARTASIHVRLNYGQTEELDYGLSFAVVNSRPQVVSETLESSTGEVYVHRTPYNFEVTPHPEGAAGLVEMALKVSDNHPRKERLNREQSLLAQVREPLIYPQLAFVGDELQKIVSFHGWSLGRDKVLTRPQRADLPGDFLLPDGSNLALVLNDLQNRRATKDLLLERLRLLYPGIEYVHTKTQGGTIQIFFHEEGFGSPVPAGRLSDGTLHYLCLLTILLHPDPPPLICIEEPEVGLHPDILPKIADLLLDASKRTQLIVTTHSETLISRLSEVPESVVVCERDDRGTHLRRLEPEKLRAWLDKYMLGELWRMGEIGANRW